MKLHPPFRICSVNEVCVVDARGDEFAYIAGDYEEDWEEMSARAQWLADRLNQPIFEDDGK